MTLKKEVLNDNLDYGNDEMSFLDLVIILIKNIKTIILTPTLLCIITIINLYLNSEPKFISTSKILLSNTSASTPVAIGLAAQMGIVVPKIKSGESFNYFEILTSRTLAREVLKQKFDTFSYGSQKSLLYILTAEVENRNTTDFEYLESIGIDGFLNMITVTENIKRGYIVLEIESSEAQLSKEINQVVLDQLSAFQEKNNKASKNATKKFIEERIISTQKELVEAEEVLKTFNDRNRRIGNSPALQLEKQRLMREVTVLIGVFTTLKQQYETTKIEEVKKLEYVKVLDPPEIPLKNSNVSKKKVVIIAGISGILLGFIIVIAVNSLQKINKKEKEKLNKAKNLIIKKVLKLIPYKT
jgi:uncharacterized protein involved in exopolysaccharide biosynthesis